MKKHYFKQRIYGVDRLLNRQLYIEESVKPILRKHQKLRDSLKGARLSVETEILLNNSVELKRRRANKEFSKNYWKELKQSHSR